MANNNDPLGNFLVGAVVGTEINKSRRLAEQRNQELIAAVREASKTPEERQAEKEAKQDALKAQWSQTPEEKEAVKAKAEARLAEIDRFTAETGLTITDWRGIKKERRRLERAGFTFSHQWTPGCEYAIIHAWTIDRDRQG